MSDRSSVAANNKRGMGTRLSTLFGIVLLAGLASCTGGIGTDPLVEFSTVLNVQGARPQSLARQLRAGIYLIEVRERDIDLRVKINAATELRELGDAYLRHGLHRTVVSLDAPSAVRVTLQSTDQRTWRGAAAIRILRWPAPVANAPADPRLLGFIALGKANELVAREDKDSWREALRPFRQAVAHFETAKDLRSLAETEYQLGWLEFNLLHQYEDARRSAESAQARFAAVDEPTGMHRAASLRALSEFELASTMAPEAPRSERHELLDRAVARLDEAREYFAEQGLLTDEIVALNRTATRPLILGDYDACARIHQQSLARAAARGDKFYEAKYSGSLGAIALRKGQAVKAVSLYERALPMVDRDRNPYLYANMISDLGYALIALGEFDRAQMLHTEALEVFSTRGDDSQTAREYGALAAIQFRTGDVERALATIESALPLFDRARDFGGEASALRLAGNAAAVLGRHREALEYLRRAERLDQTGSSLENTRVLIAGELRELGDFTRAELVLAELLKTRNEATRADALTERARLRQRQKRAAESLADLEAADAAYARLKLDFNRIDTSSALAMALLASGDIAGADQAADTAVGVETRIRASSASPELRARFLSASYAPYEARIEVDLAGAAARDPAAIWKAFRVAESLRARSLTDRLSHGAGRSAVPRDEYTDRLRATLTGLQMDLERQIRGGTTSIDEIHETRRMIDETRARLEARMVNQRGVRASNQPGISETREAVQAALPEDTAVLAYFVGDQRSHGWLLTRAGLRHATLPGRRELEKLVRAFVARQRAGATAERGAPAAVLLGTLLDGVDAKRLLVLPDGPLNGLPFAALPMPRGGAREQLLDRFVISVAPSLALALGSTERETGERLRVAVISDPVYTADDRRLVVAAGSAPNYRGAGVGGGRFARLAYSAIEARAVARAFQGADVIELAGFNATARRVIELPSRELDVLHFATHAEARRDAPEQSALFLSEYAADGTRLEVDRLTADDIARSGLRADVVVLSGCATGDGRELRGEGVLGLAYGFLGNGARTVVASLWPVEDAFTARFMEEFYSAYRASGRASDALRTAQLRTRGGAASAVWSSFVVRANQLP
jgi:CHAT domain-containing protein/tetratricopeptide (TPR) repeat protein